MRRGCKCKQQAALAIWASGSTIRGAVRSGVRLNKCCLDAPSRWVEGEGGLKEEQSLPGLS